VGDEACRREKRQDEAACRAQLFYTSKILQYRQNRGFEYIGFDVAVKHNYVKNIMVFSNTIVLLKICENTMLPSIHLVIGCERGLYLVLLQQRL
jgi:hypothetical protein